MIRIKAKETVVVAKFPLGVIIISTFSCDSHIHTITANANKFLGLLKRTGPLLTGFSVAVFGQVKAVLRHPSLVARSRYPEC